MLNYFKIKAAKWKSQQRRVILGLADKTIVLAVSFLIGLNSKLSAVITILILSLSRSDYSSFSNSTYQLHDEVAFPAQLLDVWGR